MLTALPLIKSPGRAWALLLLPGFLVALRPAWGLRVTAVLTAIGGLLLLVVAQGTPVVLGYRVTLQWGLNWQSIVDAYLLYANWHLLWFAVAAATVLGARPPFARDVAPLSATLALGFLFLFAGFAFTNAAAWVEDQTTVNRATLHLAPLAVVWLLLVYRSWSARFSASPRPAGNDAPAAA